MILNSVLKLSLSICLSLHVKAYDPLGLLFPQKMIGALLFRNILQIVNAKFPPSAAPSKIQKGKIRWDFEILDFDEENHFLSGWVQ